MEYFLRFAHPVLIYILLPLTLGFAYLRYRWYKPLMYRYSLASTIAAHGAASTHPYKKIFFGMRLLVLVLMVFLLGKPQLVDVNASVHVNGIDIVLVLDLSGSMQFQDDPNDKRSRIEVAKDEAIRFIEKRTNDAIGLVIFGKDTISRVPLTLDKTMLRTLIQDLQLGVVNPDGTMLGSAMLTGVNRLKNSQSASKVMILLTDGEPSEGDTNPHIAIDIAKKVGIKVYTIGIGSEKADFFMHPVYGLVQKPKVNIPLLRTIADGTGGKFFQAQRSQDMREIYQTIDQLEKTEYDTKVFTKYYDYFMPVLWIIVMLLLLELLLSTFVWFGL